MPRSHFNKNFRILANREGDRTNFTPADIPNIMGWWKADDLDATLNDGDDVTTWEDKTANNYDLAQAVANDKPHFKTAIIGTHDVVRFAEAPNTEDMACATVPETAQPFTIAVVAATSTATDVIVSGNVALKDALINSTAAGVYGMEAGTQLSSLTADGATPRLIHAEFNGTLSRIWVNNQHPFTQGNAGAQPIEDLIVGSNQAASLHLTGDIAEMVLVSGIMPDLYRDLLWRYLKAIYSLTGTP